MSLSETIKSAEKQEILKVADLLKEQDLLKAKYFADDDIHFVVRSEEKNEHIKQQIVNHYTEVSNGLKRYLELEDMLSGVYAENTVKVRGYRFSVATGLKILKELEEVKIDPTTGHICIVSHPLAVFLSKCCASTYGFSNEECSYIDPMHLMSNEAVEDVCWRVSQFKIELKYALERFSYETSV